MKCRHPLLIRAAGCAGALALRLWLRTLRYRYRPLGPNLDPRSRHVRSRYIYAFWHENLLLPAHRFGGTNVDVLVSQHADGQLLAEVCRHIGFRAVRGSTTRGGVQALRKLAGTRPAGHLAITPDGPRGPRRVVQPGLVYLASRLGLPIVAAGFGFDRPWRLNSWDRFALPRPGSIATCVTTDPIGVPQGAERDLLEHYRSRVEQELNALSIAAERWAAEDIEPTWQSLRPPEEGQRRAG